MVLSSVLRKLRAAKKERETADFLHTGLFSKYRTAVDERFAIGHRVDVNVQASLV